jgi:GLPGLI family protein
MIMIRKRWIALFLFSFVVVSNAQITYGKVTYERKTNLYKRFKHWEDVKEWIKESDKVKVDEFEMTFNDSSAVFKPIESEYREQFDWATNSNTTYQYKSSNTKVTFKKIWGEEFMLKDSLAKRKWKMTDGQRNIAGYNCRKAIWVENDSSRVYAWYADEIVPGFGPESFNGLPGLILGLATEDGGIIYFAKKVEIIQPKAEVFMLPKTKKKPIKTIELRDQLVKQYGKEKWGKAMLLNNFGNVN